MSVQLAIDRDGASEHETRGCASFPGGHVSTLHGGRVATIGWEVLAELPERSLSCLSCQGAIIMLVA